MQIQWFGKSWHAPICNDAQHTDTPAGQQCMFCPEVIRPDDQGFVMDYDAGTVERRPAHRVCFIRTIGVPVSARRPLPWPSYCFECGTRLMGSWTQHQKGYPIRAIIEDDGRDIDVEDIRI